MDMRVIEIDQVVALIARAIQQGADPGDESLPLLRVREAEPLVGLLPRQLEPVQRAADGLAAEAAAELLSHEANQAPQRPAWRYLGSGGRTGRLAFRGANLLAKRGGDIRTKGGGHRCVDKSAPRGRVHCRRAANPSRFARVVRCVRQPPWHNRLRRSRAAPGSVRG